MKHVFIAGSVTGIVLDTWVWPIANENVLQMWPSSWNFFQVQEYGGDRTVKPRISLRSVLRQQAIFEGE